MAICKYRHCDIEFEPIIKFIGTPMEKKYCCRKHKLAEKYLINTEKRVRKPAYKFKCRYRNCEIIFTTYDQRKRYCNRSHKQAEARIIKIESQSQKETIGRLQKKNDRDTARIFASLNCMNYMKCLYGTRMRCYKCDKSHIKKGAWQHEPGTLYHTQEDLHVICLPSSGRGE